MTRFAGYAAVFDRVDRGGDVVRSGAIRLPQEVPLLWQHRAPPVGRIEAIEEDAKGLRVIGAVDEDRLSVTRATFLAGAAPSVPLVEIREI